MTFPLPYIAPYPGADLVLTNTDTQVDTSSNQPKNATLSFGAAEANRLVGVVVGLGVTSPYERLITGVTIGGVSATAVISSFSHVSGSNQFMMALYAAKVPTGTSGTVSVSTNSDNLAIAYQVFSIPNVKSATPFDTDNFIAPTSRAASLDVPYGGVGMVFTGGAGDAGNTWSLNDGRFITAVTANPVGSTTQGIFYVAKQGLYTPTAVASGSPTYGGVMAASWERAA